MRSVRGLGSVRTLQGQAQPEGCRPCSRLSFAAEAPCSGLPHAIGNLLGLNEGISGTSSGTGMSLWSTSPAFNRLGRRKNHKYHRLLGFPDRDLLEFQSANFRQ